MRDRDQPSLTDANRRLAVKLGVAAGAMLGFGFALVPLYDVFCKATGLNGRTRDGTRNVAGRVDLSRWVTVEFNGDVMPGLPWQFQPRLRRMRVHPGQLATAWFTTHNVADRPLGGAPCPASRPRSRRAILPRSLASVSAASAWRRARHGRCR